MLPPKYKVFEHKDVKELSCFLIESGVFEGIVYHYGVVSVDPNQSEEDDLRVSYSYSIIDGELEKDKTKEFEEVVSAILFDVVTTNEGN